MGFSGKKTFNVFYSKKAALRRLFLFPSTRCFSKLIKHLNKNLHFYCIVIIQVASLKEKQKDVEGVEFRYMRNSI